MNKERRVGRRSVVRNLVKLPTQSNNEKVSRGPKKELFVDDEPFVVKRTIRSLDKFNNFPIYKSSSHEKLYEINTNNISMSTLSDVYKKPSEISPSSSSGIFRTSIMKNHRELSEPVIQSEELFNTLIDSPCTKYEKVLYSNALSKVSNKFFNCNLESKKQNHEVFKATIPKINLLPNNKNNFNKFKIPSLKDKIISKQDTSQYNNESQTLKKLLLNEEIEEKKTKEIKNIRQIKVECFNLIKIQSREIEEEIEKEFGLMENKVNNNYEKLLNKVQGQSDGADSPTSNITSETIKEQNSTEMSAFHGISNKFNKKYIFSYTPQANSKTNEQLNKDTLTPATNSFVLQEQLIQLNGSF